ncbi:MAG: hypothetical protein V1668_02255 [Patescibacteria group bacterium]
MIWQDILIAIVSASIAFSIVPQIYSNYKNKTGGVISATTSVSFVGAYLIAFAFFTLELYLSFIIIVLNGTFWLILFIQGQRYKKVKK